MDLTLVSNGSESRYTKVAIGKQRLRTLVILLTLVYMSSLFHALLPILKEESPSIFAISYAALGAISLLIGEIGRRWNRINLLIICLVGSSIAQVLSVLIAVRNNSILQVIQKRNDRGIDEKMGLFAAAAGVIGLVLQILIIVTITSLVGNMSPPKRAS
ncbi:uncharacterized protein LOC110824245 [Carica papaya]|uniref:uncharacterized protein LOC110824245 n=1 Tax=Carica papaya TaxID=3649 RepID=UPI000B8D021A|nr:uncharacterized protein LOC110824245 [Carica papaya]